MTTRTPRRVAVVGSGVAGLLAAHVLGKQTRVTLYEADTRLGGHADTHVVDGIAVDTGFIVHNDRTYPTCSGSSTSSASRPTTPTCRCRCASTGPALEYAGALGASGLFPSWRNVLDPSYLRMLTEIPRFHRDATGSWPRRSTGGERRRDAAFVRRARRVSPMFRTHFLGSLVPACGPATRPSRSTTRRATCSPSSTTTACSASSGHRTWRTVIGGSREYVESVAARAPDVRTGTKVTSVLETADRRGVTDGNGHVDAYDAVVLATTRTSRWRCSPSRPRCSARCSAP